MSQLNQSSSIPCQNIPCLTAHEYGYKSLIRPESGYDWPGVALIKCCGVARCGLCSSEHIKVCKRRTGQIRRLNPGQEEFRKIYRSISPWELQDILDKQSIEGRGAKFSSDPRSSEECHVWFGESIDEVIHNGEDYLRFFQHYEGLLPILRDMHKVEDIHRRVAREIEVDHPGNSGFHRHHPLFSLREDSDDLHTTLGEAYRKAIYALSKEARKSVLKLKIPTSYILELHEMPGGKSYTGNESLSSGRPEICFSIKEGPLLFSHLKVIYLVRRKPNKNSADIIGKVTLENVRNWNQVPLPELSPTHVERAEARRARLSRKINKLLDRFEDRAFLNRKYKKQQENLQKEIELLSEGLANKLLEDKLEKENKRSNPIYRKNSVGLMKDVCPELLEEWMDSKNKEDFPHLDKSTISAGNGANVRWKCVTCGHEWSAIVFNRCRSGTGCSKCKSVGLMKDLCPELLDEWMDSKNKEDFPHLDKSTISAGNGANVRWKCVTCNHEWPATIVARCRSGTGCSKCKKTAGSAGLMKDLCPELLDEWMDAKNQEIFPDLDKVTISIGNRARVWWKCKVCNHEWPATVGGRCHAKSGCSKCKKGPGSAGLMKDVCPELLEEWMYAKNQEIFPDLDRLTISAGSPARVWWKCKVCNHEWPATVGSRCRLGTGCLNCYRNSRKSNKPSKKFDGTGRKGSSSKSPRRSTRGGSPFDIGPKPIMRLNPFYRKNSVGLMKDLCPELLEEWMVAKNLQEFPYLDKLTISAGNGNKVWWKCKTCGHEWPAIVTNRCRSGSGCVKCLKGTGSAGLMKDVCPELLEEWSIKNQQEFPNLNKFTIGAGSNFKVWWECKICSHEWLSTISNRCRKKHGCGKCSKGAGSAGLMKEVCPELLKEWMDSKNREEFPDLDKYTVTAGNNSRVWWRCKVCGHEWTAAILNRCRAHTGCLNCYRNSKKSNKPPKKFDGTGREGSSPKSPRRSGRGGSPFDIGPKPIMRLNPNINFSLLEKLADLEHEQWAHWTRYMLKNLTPENIARWTRQCETPYNELSEKEKESDREWARKVLVLLDTGPKPIMRLNPININFEQEFLQNDLFKQFRDHPDKLRVEILDEISLNLILDNFPGLDTSKLLNGYFSKLNRLTNIEVSDSYISSGSPKGIIVRFKYKKF